MESQLTPEAFLRKAFPVAHGTADEVDQKAYLKKRDLALEYAINCTSAILSAETSRYQSILLYGSLLLTFLNLFSAKTLKLFDVEVPVDGTLFIFYGAFLAGIAVIFSLKAWVDFSRHELVRSKGAGAVGELRELLGIGALRRTLHQYFWNEAFLAIGATDRAYQEAVSSLLDMPRIPPLILDNAISVDLDAMKRIPALTREIGTMEAQRAHLAEALRGLEHRFRCEADAIISMAEEDVPADQTKYDLLRAAYESTLGPWFDARKKLTDEGFEALVVEGDQSPTIARSRDLLGLLKRMLLIRRLYFWTEVGGPLLFAAAVLVYVFS